MGMCAHASTAWAGRRWEFWEGDVFSSLAEGTNQMSCHYPPVSCNMCFFSLLIFLRPWTWNTLSHEFLRCWVVLLTYGTAHELSSVGVDKATASAVKKIAVFKVYSCDLQKWLVIFNAQLQKPDFHKARRSLFKNVEPIKVSKVGQPKSLVTLENLLLTTCLGSLEKEDCFKKQ